MARTQKTMHASVLILFAIAVVFYFLGNATSAVIFSVVGAVVELTAWVTWFRAASRTKDAEGSGGR